MPEAHGSKNVSSLTTVMMAKDASHKLKLQNVIGKVSTFLNSLLVLALYLYKQRVKLTFVEKFMIVKWKFLLVLQGPVPQSPIKLILD